MSISCENKNLDKLSHGYNKIVVGYLNPEEVVIKDKHIENFVFELCNSNYFKVRVENCVISNCIVYGTARTALFGSMYDTIIKDCEFRDIKFTDSTRISAVLAEKAYNCLIENVKFRNCTFNDDSAFFGTIVYHSQKTTIKDCEVSRCFVKSSLSGLVVSINEGNIINTVVCNSEIIGKASGGICNSNFGIIENCMFLGKVEGEGSAAACHDNDGTIKNNFFLVFSSSLSGVPTTAIFGSVCGNTGLLVYEGRRPLFVTPNNSIFIVRKSG